MISEKEKWYIFKQISDIGLGKITAKAYFNTVGLDELPDVDINTGLDVEEDKESVMLPIVQGDRKFQSYLLCILGHAFRQRGYEPIIPICKSDIPICHNMEGYKDHPAICDRCEIYSQKLSKLFGIEFKNIDSFLSRDNYGEKQISELKKYHEIEIADYAMASTRRHLKKYHIDLNNSNDRETFRRYLITGNKLVDAGKNIIEEKNVGSIVATDPVYTYGGLFLGLGEKYDIDARSVGIGYYTDQAIMLGDQNNRSPFTQYTDEEYVDRYLSKKLEKAEERELNSFLQNRFQGDLDGKDFLQDKQGRLNTSELQTIGLFTNLTWDGAVEPDKKTTFSNPFEWLDQTISIIREIDNKRFVLKPHPAEAIRTTNESILSWLDATYDTLPDNLIILTPDTDISPYKLIEEIEGGVVWSSTIGLEMSLKGIPTIVVGDTHYRGHGFTFDPGDGEKYSRRIKCLPEMDDAMIKRARRYAHLLFFKKQIDFPFYTTSGKQLRMLPVNEEDIAPGNDNIDTIIESVLTGEPAIQS